METRQLLSIVWEKSKLNLKSEAAINYLSYTWWIIEPVIHMLCYYLVFELLLNRGGPGFVYFLLTGLVPWLWFAKTINQGSNSLIGGSNLMGKQTKTSTMKTMRKTRAVPLPRTLPEAFCSLKRAVPSALVPKKRYMQSWTYNGT